MSKKFAITTTIALVALAGLSTFLFWDRGRLKDEVQVIKEERKAVDLGVVEESVFAKHDPIQSEEERINSIKEKYIKEGKRFVWADLETLEVRLYAEDGTYTELKALTKGREGSWWETPSGEYSVLSRESNHFSSLGSVWMPWSVQFYGNFFIHGWPYYPGGKEVSSSYSGGCLRMSTPDAKKVYDFVKNGTPILIVGERDSQDYASLAVKGTSAPKPPEVKAESVLVANVMTGEVHMNKNAENIRPIASVTKLMTALVASEVLNMDRSVYVNSSMLSTSPVQSYPLEVGKSYKIFDLLYPMLVQSSNGSAEAIAGFLGKDYFVKLMNKKAASLGMTNTAFADPAGVKDENASTPKDLMLMARYLMEKRRFVYQITKGENNLPWGHSPLGDIKNYNDFYDSSDVVGVKVGKTTAAQETSLIIMNIKSDKGNAPIAIIILGSPDRRSDAEILMNWVRENFKVSEA